MGLARRLCALVLALIVTLLFISAYTGNLQTDNGWKHFSGGIGVREWIQRSAQYRLGSPLKSVNQSFIATPAAQQISFVLGRPKAAGSNYTKTLVVPRMSNESVAWMDEALPAEIQRAIYTVDDPKASLRPPTNKGHEVMVYLSFIIDNYDHLPDVAMFMHSHQISWHNADLFDLDAGEMIRRLSPERVTREGYMSMRCQWSPGCPDWVHPGETNADPDKAEEVLIAKAWSQLFPNDPLPDVLAGPCCAQFALSRDRMRATPRETYLHYRDWIANTPLNDFVSGRVFEYLWHYIFTGEAAFCPVEHVCYCDGFGLCFGGEEHYNAWWDIKKERDAVNADWLKWEEDVHAWNRLIEAGYTGRELDKMGKVAHPKEGMQDVYGEKIDKLQAKLDRRIDAAIRRGNDPRLRAQDSGREWHECDGF